MNAAAASSNQFYVTLFSNSSNEIYKDNTLAAFTTKLAQPTELNYVENWEVDIYEVRRPPPIVGTGFPLTTVGNSNVLVYCVVISPQFVGSDMVRCLRTFIFSSTNCENVFDNIYYVPVEQRKFHEVRIEFVLTNGKRVPFKYSKVLTNVVLHFCKNYHW
jgi:hypothetical protein